MKEVILVFLLIFGAGANGSPQGYGNFDEDDSNHGWKSSPQFPHNEQARSWDNSQSEQSGYYDTESAPAPQTQPKGNSAASGSVSTSGSVNLWWKGQNAFQRPAGHPGVESLGLKATTSAVSNGGGSSWASSKRQQTTVTSAGHYQSQSSQSKFSSSGSSSGGGGGSGAQGHSGWGSQQQTQQSPGFGLPEASPAGCDLLNKGDCHRPNTGPSAAYEPEPYPGQPDDQNSIPDPNLSYKPSSPHNPQNFLPGPSFGPAPANPPPPGPSFGPAPAHPPPPVPKDPPYTPDPVPQQPPTYPQPQPQRPSTDPDPNTYINPPSVSPGARPLPQQFPAQPAPAPLEEDPLPYPGCPAAMLCVKDNYCNAIGVAEKSPVRLSAADRRYRVPLMQCSEQSTGVVGVCCKDPDYEDPWPNMNGMPMKKMPNPTSGKISQGSHFAGGSTSSSSSSNSHHSSSISVSGGSGGGHHGWRR